MKKEEKKTENKVIVSKEKYGKLVSENGKLVSENGKLVAENKKLESNNANLGKILCNQKKTLKALSDELLRLKSLIKSHNKKWFSRKIKL